MWMGGLDAEMLRELFQALQDHDVEYVVVGAIAMGLQGIQRATEDVDLFVRPTEENIRRLRAALTRVWPDPAIEEIRADDLAGEIGVVSYVPPSRDVHVDVISHLGEVFRFEDIEFELIPVSPGLSVRVATPRMLYRMKRDTLRYKDRIDSEWLRERFGLEEA